MIIPLWGGGGKAFDYLFVGVRRQKRSASCTFKVLDDNLGSLEVRSSGGWGAGPLCKAVMTRND